MIFVLTWLWMYALAHPAPAHEVVQRPKEKIEDWSALFAQHNLKGGMLVYDLKRNTYHVYNKARCQKTWIPASTFKIPNTLIGLETGVIQDENTMFKWDGKQRSVAAWNQDNTLQMAFQNSTVWYYQELARQVGAEKMQRWLNKLKYGNRSMEGGLDRFWLDGQLRISPYQQVAFLKHLYLNKLPVSRRSMDVLRKIMVRSEANGVVYRGKTGLSAQDGEAIGWFVGYVTKGDQAYFFALNAHAPDADAAFISARIAVSEAVLKHLGIL